MKTRDQLFNQQLAILNRQSRGQMLDSDRDALAGIQLLIYFTEDNPTEQKVEATRARLLREIIRYMEKHGIDSLYESKKKVLTLLDYLLCD